MVENNRAIVYILQGELGKTEPAGFWPAGSPCLKRTGNFGGGSVISKSISKRKQGQGDRLSRTYYPVHCQSEQALWFKGDIQGRIFVGSSRPVCIGTIHEPESASGAERA